MADQLMGDAEVLSNELLVAMVQKELIAKSILAGSVRDVSAFAEPGQKSIKFPRAGSFTVQKKLSNVAVEAEALTYASDELLLDQHAVVQWLIEKKASLQSIVALEIDAAQRAARGMAKQVDLDVYGKLKLASASNPDHRRAFAGATIARTDILLARELLKQAEAWEDGLMYLGVNPQEEADLLDISDFIDASKYGSSMPIQNGEIGMVYGVRILVTSNVDAGLPVLYHRDAVALGFQSGPEFETEGELKHLAKRYSIDQLYGVKEMNLGKMAVLLGSAS